MSTSDRGAGSFRVRRDSPCDSTVLSRSAKTTIARTLSVAILMWVNEAPSVLV